MSRAPTHQCARMLAVLRAAEGQIVARADLLDAIYPPGTTRPARARENVITVACALRADGHAIIVRKGFGYALVSGSTADPNDVRPSTAQGARMLAALRASHGAVVSRSALIEAIYPPDVERPASAAFNVSNVANSLRADGHNVVLHRGVGYALEKEQSIAPAPAAVPAVKVLTPKPPAAPMMWLGRSQ